MDNVTLFSRRVPTVIPERITEARQALGMSMADLGRAVNVSRQAISYYETGAKQPESEVLIQLGRALKQPIAYFTTARPESHGRSGTVFFRSFASKTKTTNKRCERYRDWLDQTAHYLSGMVGLPAPGILPAAPRNDLGYTLFEIEEIATRCRRSWGLGDGPIANLLLLLESKGVIAVRTDIVDAPALDAFSCWIGIRPFVFLSADRTAVRSRFDAAHELGHLILHSGITPEQMEDDAIHSRVEREANQFAGAFLLPRESFRTEIHSTRLNSFIALKRRWGVSIGAMVSRCRDIGVIGDYEFRRLRKLMSHYGYIKFEPLDGEIPPEEPTLLKRSIDLLIAKNVKDAAAILADLRLSPETIAAITGIEVSRFEFAEPNRVDLSLRERS
jgi:Zn-dependent peptidase ImmA (M78 family)/transcriptional regulator with XRE-family HTH domain